MSWLFTIALASTFVGIAVTVRTIRRQNASLTRRGPVPGYSRTPGGAVELGELTGGWAGTRWMVTSLEEFHSPGRTRLILSLEVREEGGDTDDAILAVARRLRERVPVDVVYVDAGVPRLLYSPDGGGWSGEGNSDIYFSERV
jgi:hypothetical protein